MTRWKCGGNLSNYPLYDHHYFPGIKSLYRTSCDTRTRFAQCPLYGEPVCRLDLPERRGTDRPIFETPTRDHEDPWRDAKERNETMGVLEFEGSSQREKIIAQALE